MTLQRMSLRAEIPRPIVHPDTEPFWTGLSRGELLAQVCERCGTYRFPFAPVCFKCLAFEHSWRTLAPEGRLVVSVTVRRATGDALWAAHVPFASGLVDMEHDIRLPGSIVCTCGRGLNRGARLRAVVLRTDSGVETYGFAHECAD